VMNDTARRSKTIGHSAMGQELKARPLDWGPRVVGLHQGQRIPSAPTGRTYDRRPPAVHRPNKKLAKGPSTYDPLENNIRKERPFLCSLAMAQLDPLLPSRSAL
jgi:hypothetical protein